MANLARLAGVAKGTLYLYFPTREELILTLYNRHVEMWSRSFIDRLAPGVTDSEFVDLFYETAESDTIVIPLVTRPEHVIEHNVSIAHLFASKRRFKACLALIARQAKSLLNLSTDQSDELVITLGVLLAGATRADQGPSLEGEDIPSDIKGLLDTLSSKVMFTRNAMRIIHGIRNPVAR